ncbi:hypothetical protein Tco_1057020 [Tanacetum coccineum]|uniref:Uncharacterized protein n=1 Tax=Tanacetum coccineum TaxID=301880 RepID=A0ABQ5H4A5_9ASTR
MISCCVRSTVGSSWHLDRDSLSIILLGYRSSAYVSKPISIPNEEFSDDTTPSVAQKFLNEVKSTIVNLQRVVKEEMTLDIHNWLYSVHQEIQKIIKDEIVPIVNQIDARLQNFKIQFLKEVDKFVRDFKSLVKEADESLAKHKYLELEIERLLRAVVSQDIMSIVQSNSVVDTSNLQTELEPNNDMQQKIGWLQAQLGDLKGKSKDTPYVSNTLDPLSQKLENENAQTKTIIDSLQNKLHDTIYENAKLRAQLFDKVSEQEDTTKGLDNTSKTRKPQPRSNTKNDRVPYESKSSCINNKEVEVEEHPRNLLLSKNKKHMSSECNNVKLAI